MDKKRVGNYIKQLRTQKKNAEGKHYTQEDLVNDFSSIYDQSISINAIGEWENGTSLPTPANLKILSKIYCRTIDEILDGEDREDIDYSDVYLMANKDWYTKYDDQTDTYTLRNNQIRTIVARFKELIKTRLVRFFTDNEEREFRFLFEHFYSLSEHASEISTTKDGDDYLVLKDAINNVLVSTRDMGIEEKYWEVQKLYSEKSEIWFSFFGDVCDLKDIAILKERFNEIENWQKDMLLAMFQKIEPFDPKPYQYGSNHYKRYEQEHGEYNHDEMVKNEIREMIKGGACINIKFMEVKTALLFAKRIIDKLEQLYDKCLKPIEIHSIDDEGKYKSYKIENNFKNRFVNQYYIPLKQALNRYDEGEDKYHDIEELFEWFKSNNAVSEEKYYEIARNLRIDTNEEKKYWLNEVKQRSRIDDVFNKYKEEEKSIEEGKKTIELLISKLKNGETVFEEYVELSNDGNKEETIRERTKILINEMSYDEFLASRDEKLTSSLLMDLDLLSFDEIKKKYFELEVGSYEQF